MKRIAWFDEVGIDDVAIVGGKNASLGEMYQNEQDPAVERACSMVISASHAAGRKIGICGQGPSDHPEFAAFLVREGIDSISVTPDAVAKTLQRVADAEALLR